MGENIGELVAEHPLFSGLPADVAELVGGCSEKCDRDRPAHAGRRRACSFAVPVADAATSPSRCTNKGGYHSSSTASVRGSPSAGPGCSRPTGGTSTPGRSSPWEPSQSMPSVCEPRRGRPGLRLSAHEATRRRRARPPPGDAAPAARRLRARDLLDGAGQRRSPPPSRGRF